MLEIIVILLAVIVGLMLLKWVVFPIAGDLVYAVVWLVVLVVTGGKVDLDKRDQGRR